MALYPYLHIALRGDVEGNTGTLYSYPSTPSAIDPRWNSSTVEPGAAIKRFLNANECYILQDSPVGHYFSFITRNTLNPERGFMMICALVETGCALTGRQIMNLFSGLRRVLIEEENRTDEAVDKAITAAGIPQLPLMLDAWAYQAPAGNAIPAEAAYRTYTSQQELEAILTFPSQPEYADYRCILVVSAATSLRPGVKMPRITTPVRKLYSIVCPEGVKTSSGQIYDGERLEIIYTLPGFDDHKENIVVGAPSAFVKYDGPTISIRTPQQTGIRFERKTPVKVISAKGLPIQGYTITLNGRSVNTMEPFVSFYEKDLEPGTDVSFVVRSTNFRTLKFKKSAEEMLTTDSLEFVMHPVEKGITLRLDFGDGRVFEQQISIEKNTAEYNRLHSGSFHGFRAHRLVTDADDEGEIYNVDVRTPVHTISAGTDTMPAPVVRSEKPYKAPHFENVASEAQAEAKPKIDTSLPEKEHESTEPEEKPARAYDNTTPTVVASTPAAESEAAAPSEAADSTEAIPPVYRRRGYLITAIAIVVIAAGVYLFSLRGSSTSAPAGAAGTTDTTATASAAQDAPTAMTADEQADVDYLNANTTWSKSKMRSPMGNALFEAIAAGDIDAVVNNDYLSIRGRATNKKALELADLLWRAKGSYSDASNRNLLRKSLPEGKDLDLVVLVDGLAKRRPSEKANETPRPQR